ncbi:MAG: TolC family protein [bacterium]|nr:TolC family protein [bacterium]
MILILLSLIAADTLHINLRQAKEMAIKTNPAYKIDALSHTQSKISLYENLSSNILSPSLSGNYNYSNPGYGIFEPIKGYYFNFSLTQPVFNVSQTASLLQSGINKNAAGYLRKESENQLNYQVESCYLSVLKSQKLFDLRKEGVERADENMRLVQKKLYLGQSSKLDSLNAEVQVAKAKLNYFTSKKDFKVAERFLLNVIGVYRDCEIALEPVETEGKEYAIPPLDSIVEIALKKRPSIKAASLELQESRVAYYKNVLSFLPQVSFKWLWGYGSEEFPQDISEIRDNASKSTGWQGSVGVDFSYPFEFWQSKTTLDKSKLDFLNKRLILAKEIESIWFGYYEIEENMKLAENMFLAAEESDRLAKTQYELGVISAIDLFKVSTDRLEAEITYTNALYDYRLIYTQLQFLIGGNSK